MTRDMIKLIKMHINNNIITPNNNALSGNTIYTWPTVTMVPLVFEGSCYFDHPPFLCRYLARFGNPTGQ